MITKILTIIINILNHIATNISDYTLIVGVGLVLRWIYVVKGFDSFTLCLGFTFILFSFVNGYNKIRR